MVQLIVGKKGKGKTKQLLDKVNSEIKLVDGNIAYLDKSTKHMFELNNKVRLIDVSEYMVENSDEFIGFISGILSQDHDLQQMYFDSFLKIANLEGQDITPVVEKLEKDGRGLNLTWEVRDGIVNHTGSHLASTLEGVIIKYADRIAYINHDIDDSIRGGIITLDDIPKHLLDVLGRGHSERVNTMVSSVIEASRDSNEIKMTEGVGKATNELRKFLFDNVYYNPKAKREEVKAMELLKNLFDYFVKYPKKMPALYYNNTRNESVERCVCDYISGMTDRYAIDLYKDLFIPHVWETPMEL